MEQGFLHEPLPPRPPAAPDRVPDTARAQFHEAARLLRKGQPAAADPYARRVLELDPTSPDAALLAAQVALGCGELERAEDLLGQARAHGRVHAQASAPEALSLLARQIAGRRAQAREAERRARRSTAGPRPPRATAAAAAAAPVPAEAPPTLSLPAPELTLAPALAPATGAASADPATALQDFLLRLGAGRIARLSSFDTLLALSAVHNVDHYEYQLRTVRRVLRDFRGRVLLADEVGLGKTIEACLCLKEYLLRGLVRRVLVLTPAALCVQWRDELAEKFAVEARLLDGDDLRGAAPGLAGEGVSIVSLGLARLPAAAAALAETRFDLVIVDEAHRLKNRRTRTWQAVDALRARFLLLLSATPIENDLVEIYNVLTLLKPGLFSTEAEFKRAFVGKSGRDPKDADRLRALLREVMIRNTRALADVKLPPRFATTLRAEPGERERELYRGVERALRDGLALGRLGKARVGETLRALGSSPHAAQDLVTRHLGAELALATAELARAAMPLAKDELLLDLLGKQRDDKVLLFAGHRRSLEHVHELALGAGRRPVLFHGSLSLGEKQAAIESFAKEADVLVASESGGEGFNLHFARTIVNYDLPWNPMRIEQRIGRVHRIGQTREVFVFNLVTAGTVEEELLRVLDEKINMFELVVGEIEMILGRLGDDEQDFQDLVLEIYTAAGDPQAVRAGFDALGAKMLAARAEHAESKRLQDTVLGQDLGA